MLFRFCPGCGAAAPRFDAGKRVVCGICGFEYFHNVAAAAGAFIEADGRLVFIRRAKDPALGLLALPGGFVDPSESAEDAVRRECREEIGWTPGDIDFLGSFPNRYLYAGIEYNTCDLFFLVRAPGLRESDLELDADEASQVIFIAPELVRLDDLAFDSTRRAFSLYRSRLRFA